MVEKKSVIRNFLLLIVAVAIIGSYGYVFYQHNTIISRDLSDDVQIYYSDSDHDGFAYKNDNMAVGLKNLGLTHFEFYNLDPDKSSHIYLAFKLNGFDPDTKYNVNVTFNFKDLDPNQDNPINVNVDILQNLSSDNQEDIMYDTSFALSNKLNLYNDSGVIKTEFEFTTDKFNDNYLVIDIYKLGSEELNFDIENIKVNYKEIYE